MFRPVPSMTKSNANWQYTDTRLRIATGCGSEGTGSTRRNPFRQGTIDRTFHRQYSPARRPSLHKSPMPGTSIWKLYSRCAEKSDRTDQLMRSRRLSIRPRHQQHAAYSVQDLPTRCRSPLRQLYFQHVQRRSMSRFQFLPSISDSEAITCRRCNRRQYPRNGKCIACHCTLNVGYVVFEIEGPTEGRSEDHHKQLAHRVGSLLRSLRRRGGICQSEMARMAAGIDRSYLSKAECGRVLLHFNSLLTLLQALGLSGVILRFDLTGPRAIPKSICPR